MPTLSFQKFVSLFDGRYNIPYKHPLNDYISLVGGYEREERDDIGQGVNLLTESAVAGADRVIKNPMGNWQHTYGVRYRLDRLTQKGISECKMICLMHLLPIMTQSKSRFYWVMKFLESIAINV